MAHQIRKLVSQFADTAALPDPASALYPLTPPPTTAVVAIPSAGGGGDGGPCPSNLGGHAAAAAEEEGGAGVPARASCGWISAGAGACGGAPPAAVGLGGRTAVVLNGTATGVGGAQPAGKRAEGGSDAACGLECGLADRLTAATGGLTGPGQAAGREPERPSDIALQEIDDWRQRALVF